MVVKRHITQSLQLINRLYRGSLTSQNQESVIYSKIAILETCGWIEQTMDDIALRCCKRLNIPSSEIDEYKESTIKRTHAFDYGNNFRPMLQKLIGLRSLNRMEIKANSTKLDLLKSSLGSLKKIRDEIAHTHIRGVTLKLDAPSVTMQRLIQVYDGLLEIDRVLRQMRF